jgi:hypothetical protein
MAYEPKPNSCGLLVGTHTHLSTFRANPDELPRTTRGRCGSLLLHLNGLSPPNPCRSPGTPRLKCQLLQLMLGGSA